MVSPETSLKVIETVDVYAPFIGQCLVLGETGVGKELVARRIHHKSNRSQGPFVPINCGAIPPGLFESELFGHERGAFSGATQFSKGMIRQAQGGTLFLDEIGELDLALQVKLLRLIDLGEVRALGSARTENVNVRVIAATNVDLRRRSPPRPFPPRSARAAFGAQHTSSAIARAQGGYSA